MNSIYSINRGINKSIEFKGLKAQYIWYFAGGMIILMILFSILYIIGLHSYLCLIIIAIGAIALIKKVFYWSKTYGEYGMMKYLASKRIPKHLKSYSRQPFQFKED